MSTLETAIELSKAYCSTSIASPTYTMPSRSSKWQSLPRAMACHVKRVRVNVCAGLMKRTTADRTFMCLRWARPLVNRSPRIVIIRHLEALLDGSAPSALKRPASPLLSLPMLSLQFCELGAFPPSTKMILWSLRRVVCLSWIFPLRDWRIVGRKQVQ